MPATTRCLLLGAALLLPWVAHAQGDLKPGFAPTAPAAAPEEAALPDPPARAGRLAVVSGGVSLRDAAQPQWQPAEHNLPITAGTGLWTEARGRALLEIPGVNLGLESGSALEWTRLDDGGAEASLGQGALALLVRALDPDDTLRIATPRGVVEILKPGRFVIEAGAEGQPTRLLVQQGHAAWVSADGSRSLLGPGQALSTSGEAPVIATAEAPPILAWTLAQEPKFHEVPQSVALMPGGRQLAEFGRWSRHPDYGDIWRPDVPAGWVPFRDGQWRWTDPWGWTWRDAQPWGFATSHYGRWFEYDGAWAWAPVVVAPVVVRRWPVFTPAVVGFFTPPGRWGGGRPVAWAPLAPHEPFWPGRRFSPGYVQRVNAWTVRDAHGLGPRRPPPVFAHVGAATAVPGAVFAGARPVAPNRLPFSGPPQAGLTPATLPPRPFVTPGRPPVDPLRPPLTGLPPGQRPGFVPPVDAVRPGAPNAPMLPPLVGRGPGGPPPLAARPPGQRPGFVPQGDPLRPGFVPPNAGLPPAQRPGFVPQGDPLRPGFVPPNAALPPAQRPGFVPQGDPLRPGFVPPNAGLPPAQRPGFVPQGDPLRPGFVPPRPSPPIAAPPPMRPPVMASPPPAFVSPRPAPAPSFAPPPRPAVPSFVSPPPPPRQAPQQQNPFLRR